MTDTSFGTKPDDLPQLAALYGRGAVDGKATRMDGLGAAAQKKPVMLSGGGGLVSTAADYHRFMQMLLATEDSPSGELDGVRLLSSRTVGYMTRNHLPGNQDLATYGRPLNAESPQVGTGFGLGFAVVIDPASLKVVCSEASCPGAAPPRPPSGSTRPRSSR